ncbi:MAG: hypothetical protein HY005_02385 [Candidatus Staskawiczbacteria bacterium]|nr:hypothetical protein [Candidatus Staskawiczbacteria bacterium]
MKKLFLITLLILLLSPSIFVFAQIGPPDSLVPCGGPDCTIEDFFLMLAKIYRFIVWMIATPLAVLMMTIGGIMILISAGNPNLAGMGKKMLWVSAIGLVLVFCSWLIVNFILTTLGYQRAWNVL